jgi:hypothetical protein
MATNTHIDHPLLAEEVPTFLEPSGSSREHQGGSALNNLDWRQAAGIGILVVGALALILGWYGVSGTTNTAQQLSYFLSGGIGGAALIAIGIALLMSYEHVADRRALSRLEERLDRMEMGLASEFDALREESNGSRYSNDVRSTRRSRPSES